MADILATQLTADPTKLIKGLEKARKSFTKFTVSTTKQIGRTTKAFASLSAKALFFGGTATTVFIKMASDLEASMTDVRKTTGLSESEIEKLRQSFLKLSTSVPQSAKELAKIGEVAGQLGIKGVRNIKAFTETIAKVVTVTDFTVEEASASLAKLSNLFGIPIQEVNRLASAMNELENTTTATSPALVEFMRRIAPSATQLKITASEVAGLSATLINLGQNAESSGTAIQKTFLAMITQGQVFANQMGISISKFQEMVERDAMGTLNEWLKLMSETTTPVEFIKKLDDLGLSGERVRAVLLGLKDATVDLSNNLSTSNKAFEKATSLQKEFEVFMGATKNQFKTLFDAIKKVAIELGTPLLGPFKHVMGVMKDELLNAEIDAEKFGNSVIEVFKSMGKAFLLFLDIFNRVFSALGKFFGESMRLMGMTGEFLTQTERNLESKVINAQKRLDTLVQQRIDAEKQIASATTADDLSYDNLLGMTAEWQMPGIIEGISRLKKEIKTLHEEQEKLTREGSGFTKMEKFGEGISNATDTASNGIVKLLKHLDRLGTKIGGFTLSSPKVGQDIIPALPPPVPKTPAVISKLPGDDFLFGDSEKLEEEFKTYIGFMKKKEQAEALWVKRVRFDSAELLDHKQGLLQKEIELLEEAKIGQGEIERFHHDSMFAILEEVNLRIIEEERLKQATIADLNATTLFQMATDEQLFKTKRIEALNELKSRNLSFFEAMKLGWNEYKLEQISITQTIAQFTVDSFHTMERGLSNAISGMVQGTRSFADSVKGIFDSILSSFISMVSQMIARWLFFKAMSSVGVPGFSSGGMIPGKEDGLFLGKSGEGVLTKEGVATVGGKAGLNLLNSGSVPSIMGVTQHGFLSFMQGKPAGFIGPLLPQSGFQQFGSNVISGLGSMGGMIGGAVGGIAAGFANQKLFAPSTASSLGGTAGSIAGSVIAAGMGLGPIGIGVGALLGGIGGGGIGAAISGSKKLHAGERGFGSTFLAIQGQNRFGGTVNSDIAKNLALTRLQHPDTGADSASDALHEMAGRVNVNIREQTLLGFKQLMAEGHMTRSEIEQGLVKDLVVLKGAFGSGGIVPGGPGLALVNENGPEAIIPLQNGAVPVSFGDNKMTGLLASISEILERLEERVESESKEIVLQMDSEVLGKIILERSQAGLETIHSNGLVGVS